MAVPLIYVAVAGGRIAYSFLRTPAGRTAAKEFIKRLGPKGKNAKITNSKPPNVKVTQGPRRVNPEKPNQPVNPTTGKFQKPSTPPAVKKPGGPPKVESKPKIDKKPPKVVKSKPKNVTTTGPKKPGQSKKNMKDVSPSNIKVGKDPKILGRKPKTLAPAAVRLATLDIKADVTAAPVIKKKPKKRPTTKDKTDRKYVPSNVQEEKKKTTTKKSTVKPKPKPKTTPKKPIPKKKPKPNPLSGISDSRRKSLKSSRIGTDAGAGMVWIVGKNTNAFVRVKPSDPRVSKQKQQRKMLKSIK